MEFKNNHIQAAFQLISSLSVSGDAVDLIWAVRQQLMMADQDFGEKEEEGQNDG